MEFLIWLSGLKAQHRVHEDVGSILGLAQWVKGQVMPQAAVRVTDAAQIWCCCGCGSDVTPSPGTSICHKCGPKKKKKRKQKYVYNNIFTKA